MEWVERGIEILWRNAVMVVPFALFAAIVCRWLARRAATRHAVWLGVLVWFLVAGLLPGAPFIDEPANRESTGSVAAAPAVARMSPPADEPAAPDTRLPTANVNNDHASPPPGVASSGRAHRNGARKVDSATAPGRIERDERTPAGRSPFAESALRISVASGGGDAAAIESPAPPSRMESLASDQQMRDTAPPSPVLVVQKQADRVGMGSRFGAAGAASARVPPALPRYSATAQGQPTGESLVLRKPGITATSGEAPIISGNTATDQGTSLLSSGAGGYRETPSPATGVSEPDIAARKKSHVSPTRQWVMYWTTARNALAGIPMLPAQVWLVGLLAVLLIEAAQLFRAARQLRSAIPAPRWIEREVQSVARRLGVSCPTTVLVDRPISPMIWCGRRLRLVLPLELWAQLDRSGRRAVICHELAHLRRRDHWVCRVELIVAALFWWHPLAWWVRRRIAEEADLSCDAWVRWLMPQQRRAYAEALLRTRQYLSDADTTCVASVGLMTSGAKRFARRLTMVMTDSSRPGLSLPGFTLVAALAVLGWSTAPAWSCPPEEKRSGQKAEVEKKGTGVSGSGFAPSAPPAPTTPPASPQPPRAGVLRARPVAPTPPAAPAQSSRARGMGRALLSATASGGAAGVGGDGEARTFEGHLRSRAILQGGIDEDVLRQLERLRVELDRLREEIGRMRAPMPPLPPESPMPPGAPALAPPSEGLEARIYELPPGKLAALTKLLTRADVPIRVRPLDGAIEVHAAPMQHEIFGEFVAMIRGEWQHRSYKLPEGKLADLAALMARQDVPITVSYGKKEINVQATPDQHATFAAFLELIQPGVQPAAVGEFRERLARLRVGAERASEASAAAAERLVRRLADAARNSAHRRGDYARALEERARAMERQSQQLERQAQELMRRAEELERRSEQLRESKPSKEASKEESRAFELDSKQHVRQARELEAHAEAISREAMRIEAEAKRVEEQMRAEQESARELDEALSRIGRVVAVEAAQTFARSAALAEELSAMQGVFAPKARAELEAALARYRESVNGLLPKIPDGLMDAAALEAALVERYDRDEIEPEDVEWSEDEIENEDDNPEDLEEESVTLVPAPAIAPVQPGTTPVPFAPVLAPVTPVTTPPDSLFAPAPRQTPAPRSSPHNSVR